MEGSKVVTGISAPHRENNVVALLQDARSDCFDFIATRLPHTSACFGRIDVTRLESKWWSTTVVGEVLSPPLYFDQDKDAMMESESSSRDQGEAIIQALYKSNALSSTAEKHLSFMLDWAGHMNIPAVILPPIPKESYIPYGRFLATQCLKASANNLQLWIRVPFTEAGLQSFRELHKMCDNPSNVGAMLSFSDSNVVTPEAIGRSLVLLHHFCACNLRAVHFNTNSFLTNKKGYPTLSKTIQFLFTELLKRLGRTLRVLIGGELLHHSETESKEVKGESGYLSYLQYLRHLRLKQEVTSVLDTEESRMELDYLDHLQSALQPCFDNLEFSTYEVFERDPVKYVRYQESIECALEDKIELGQLLVDKKDHQKTILNALIFVVGAGRGPLVKASITAISNINNKNKQVQVKAKIIAVEKNPSAVIFLHSLKCSHADWNVVEVVECDMRFASQNDILSRIISGDKEKRADIIVSELLGSFGDNELSPECLDGVQKSGLMKDSCVSIPQSYESFLAPTSSMRLHSEAKAQAYQPSDAMEGPSGKPCGNLGAMETPYVVRSHSAIQTHKELSCWTFSHPKKEDMFVQNEAEEVKNERHVELNFTDDLSSAVGYRCGYGNKDNTIANIASSVKSDIDRNGSYTLHGFLGTFDCLLYKTNDKKSITISIAPDSFSTGMYSWFPLFFPLREPLIAPFGTNIRCNIWRKSDAKGVWYEWYAEVLDKKSHEVVGASYVHNLNGRSSKILL